jgi:hypothetical protein
MSSEYAIDVLVWSNDDLLRYVVSSKEIDTANEKRSGKPRHLYDTSSILHKNLILCMFLVLREQRLWLRRENIHSTFSLLYQNDNGERFPVRQMSSEPLTRKTLNAFVLQYQFPNRDDAMRFKLIWG